MYITKIIFLANAGENDSEPNYGETDTVFKPASGYIRPGAIGGFCENGTGSSFVYYTTSKLLEQLTDRKLVKNDRSFVQLFRK
jgi:hypothetical protein